jgi:Putative Actinobacterial Holin-X, holin superfamily III
MHTQAPETNGHGLGAAAKTVAEHASSIARLELRLALIEVKTKVTALGLGIGLLVGAALFGLFLLAFVLATATALIALALPVWAALLIMTGAVLGSVATLALGGLAAVRKGAPPVPEQAIAEAKLTTEAIRGQ